MHGSSISALLCCWRSLWPCREGPTAPIRLPGLTLTRLPVKELEETGSIHRGTVFFSVFMAGEDVRHRGRGNLAELCRGFGCWHGGMPCSGPQLPPYGAGAFLGGVFVCGRMCPTSHPPPHQPPGGKSCWRSLSATRERLSYTSRRNLGINSCSLWGRGGSARPVPCALCLPGQLQRVWELGHASFGMVALGCSSSGSTEPAGLGPTPSPAPGEGEELENWFWFCPHPFGFLALTWSTVVCAGPACHSVSSRDSDLSCAGCQWLFAGGEAFQCPHLGKAPVSFCVGVEGAKPEDSVSWPLPQPPKSHRASAKGKGDAWSASRVSHAASRILAPTAGTQQQD